MSASRGEESDGSAIGQQRPGPGRQTAVRFVLLVGPLAGVAALDLQLHVQAALPIGTCVSGSSQVAWLEYDQSREKLSLCHCPLHRLKEACLFALLSVTLVLFQSVGFLSCLASSPCRQLTGHGV